MKMESWFTTPIWIADISCDWQRVQQGCQAIRRRDAGRIVSNYGGWQSNKLDLRQYEEFQELSTALNKSFASVCSQIDREFKIRADDYWININGAHDYNFSHYHPLTALSGAVYVAADSDSGEIVFESPTLGQHYPLSSPNPLFGKSIAYKPRQGMLLVFPSWISHQVVPSPRSRNERISISFNLQQTNVSF